MKIIRFLLLIFVLYPLITFSQKQNIFFKKDDWKKEIQKGGNFMVIPDIASDIYSDTLQLHSFVLFKYSKIKFILQEIKNSGFVDCLVGFDTLGQGIIVVDNNRNQIFTDDPIYHYTLFKTGQVNDDYIKQLPVIKFENVPLIDIDGNSCKETFELVCDITAPGKQGSIDYASAKKVKTLNLRVLINNYFSANIEENGKLYKLTYIQNPFSTGEKKYKGFDYFKPFNFITISKIDSNNTELLLSKKNTDFPKLEFELENFNKIIFLEFDSDKKTGKIELNRYEEKNKQLPKTFLTQNLKTGERLNIQQENEKKSILYFTGSWCAACKTIKPELDSFYTKNTEEFNFFTIAVEKNKKEAEQFITLQNYKGNCYFEPLLPLTEPAYCKNHFNITSYPHILLLESDGSVLFRSDGTDCIWQLESFLKQMQILKKKN